MLMRMSQASRPCTSGLPPHFASAINSALRKPQASLLKRAVECRLLPRKRGFQLFLPAVFVLGKQTRDGRMPDRHDLANANLVDDFADPIANQADVFWK
jgi:hypothetical protein